MNRRLAALRESFNYALWLLYATITEKPYTPGPLDPWTSGEQKTRAQLEPWMANELYARTVIWRYMQIHGQDYGRVRLNQLSNHRRRLALLPNRQEAP